MCLSMSCFMTFISLVPAQGSTCCLWVLSKWGVVRGLRGMLRADGKYFSVHLMFNLR